MNLKRAVISFKDCLNKEYQVLIGSKYASKSSVLSQLDIRKVLIHRSYARRFYITATPAPQFGAGFVTVLKYQLASKAKHFVIQF